MDTLVRQKSLIGEQNCEKLKNATITDVNVKLNLTKTFDAGVDGDIKYALQLRRDLAKSSVKKYTAMESAVCDDSRARGLIQFYGANRTGRYAGRLIQVQNLPQNHLPAC